MARGGKRTGAGRKKGTRAKKTVELLEAVTTSGETPLEYMLRVMRDPIASFDRRDEMAKAAAPYVHSKMPTAVIIPPPPSADTNPDDDDILKRYLSGLHDEAEQD